MHSILWSPLTIEPPSCSTSGAKEDSIQHLLCSRESTATFVLWEGQSGLLDRGKIFSKQNSSSFMVLGCETLCQPQRDKPANMMQRVTESIPQQQVLALWVLDSGGMLCEPNSLCSDVSQVAIRPHEPCSLHHQQEHLANDQDHAQIP